MSKKIFIVGMYKSGTSWLLGVLSAHPDLIGLRELDLVKAVCRKRGRRMVDRSARERIEQIFGSSSWCSLDRKYLEYDACREFLEVDELQEALTFKNLSEFPADMAIRLLVRMREATVNKEILRKTGKIGNVKLKMGNRAGHDRSRPMSFAALDEKSLIELYESMRVAQTAEEAMLNFLRIMDRELKPPAGLVLKGADQISGIEFLVKHMHGATGTA